MFEAKLIMATLPTCPKCGCEIVALTSRPDSAPIACLQPGCTTRTTPAVRRPVGFRQRHDTPTGRFRAAARRVVSRAFSAIGDHRSVGAGGDGGRLSRPAEKTGPARRAENHSSANRPTIPLSPNGSTAKPALWPGINHPNIVAVHDFGEVTVFGSRLRRQHRRSRCITL